MAKSKAAPAVPVEGIPSGSLIMPTEADFATAPPVVADDDKPGRVAGLDYEAWAAAIIDLNAPADRVAKERARLVQKGYRQAGGQPLVSGWSNPEVWVIPRQRYLANRAARLQRLTDMVANGRMTESALAREVVTRA